MSATPSPTPSEPADLDLAQSETVAPAAFGDDAVDDHVTIENNGPGDATDVVLHDVAPTGATIDSATIDQGIVLGQRDRGDLRGPAPRRRRVRRGRRRPRGAAGRRRWRARRARPASARLSSTPPRRTTAARRRPRCRRPAPRWRISSIQDHESSSQDALGGTLIDTITVVNNGPGDGDRRRPHRRARRRRAGDRDRPGSVHVQLRRGRPMQPGRARAGRERDRSRCTSDRCAQGELIDDVTASDDQFDPNYANDSAKTTATVTPRAHRGEGADRARFNRSRRPGTWSASWSRSE